MIHFMLFVNEDQIIETNLLLKEFNVKERLNVSKIMKLLYIFLNFDLRRKSYKLIQIQIKIFNRLIKLFLNIFKNLVILKDIKKLCKCGFDFNE